MGQQKAFWTRQSVLSIYEQPLLDLIFEAAKWHRQFHNSNEVQKATLLSIKTGGCPEDCAYCPQSAHYATGVDRNGLLPLEQVLDSAKKAKDEGASRFCMGAAWRQVKDGAE